MMRRFLLLQTMILCWFILPAQDTTSNSGQINAAGKLLQSNSKITIGGYAQIDYNQPIDPGKKINGNLDVHRMVLLFGYKFNSRLQFVTEIEIEHVKEVFVEQAFIKYKLTNWLNFKGGLVLIPMGIVNEYHEPPTFNGVERPSVDYYIIPTTWRDIGIGFTGLVREANIKYQLYVVNGLISYDGSARLSGKYALRKGRQKGAKAIMNQPSVTGKVEYYGIQGLNIGLSGYFGKTASTLFDGIDNDNVTEMSTADSSIVGINLVGIDARFTKKGFSFRGQFNYGSFSNTKEYNEFAGSDFGSSIMGYYLELAYDVFHTCQKINSQLTPFIRYENYNTQNTVAQGIVKDLAFHKEEITFGFGWEPVTGVAFKVDYQLVKPKSKQDFQQQFNAGIGIWF